MCSPRQAKVAVGENNFFCHIEVRPNLAASLPHLRGCCRTTTHRPQSKIFSMDLSSYQRQHHSMGCIGSIQFLPSRLKPPENNFHDGKEQQWADGVTLFKTLSKANARF